MSGFEGRWSAHPEAPGDHAKPPVLKRDEGDSTRVARVVGVGAMCVLGKSVVDDGRTQSFSVSEFLRLEDGQRVVLHADRGFTLGASSGALRDGLTRDMIVHDVLNVVLPDDDTSGEDHPWSWLAELARGRGLDVTAEDLRGLPYEVILADDVARWLVPS